MISWSKVKEVEKVEQVKINLTLKKLFKTFEKQLVYQLLVDFYNQGAAFRHAVKNLSRMRFLG